MAGAAFAQQSPAAFSHKKHLALGLQCLTCHSRIVRSTSPIDNNLPDPQVCRGCHESVAIKQPRKAQLYKFSHAEHIKLDRIGDVIAGAIQSGAYLGHPAPDPAIYQSASQCGGCHRGIETSESLDGSHFPLMADCLVCHSKIDNPFSCETCHEPGPHLKPASHVAGFLDLHSSGKMKLDKQSCHVCHGRRFTCLGCH